MSVIRDARQIAASAGVTNLVAGSKFEFLARNSVVEVFACQDTADDGTVLLDVSFGNLLEGDALAVPTFTAEFGPDRDKHKLISAIAQAGDRLQLKVANTDAVNVTNLRTLITITSV
ncbi:unnamed protein product [marine sediment metagenome]|uniref:Uncharacterized protein n=1 Tax=marine sediment metagenome TaxID=412755 RepID=X1DBU1_9ZZZZ